MHPDSLVDLLMDFPPAMHIVRRKPAAHSFGLQVGIQPLLRTIWTFPESGRLCDCALIRKYFDFVNHSLH